MAQRFSVQIDLAHLVQLDAFARVGLFANLSAQVADLAETGVQRWREATDAVPGLWQGERDAYKAAIHAVQVGPYEWEIVNDYKYVEDIETGRPARDLKVMLRTSLKVRVNKKGQRYLIIPFRHNTPGYSAHARAMPAGIYAEARQLIPTRIVGHGTRRSGTGAYDIDSRKPIRVRTRKYAWGGRLPAGLAPKLQTRHKTDPYAGMVRMTNAAGGSSFLTFRVMGEWSSGWIIPARPGLHIAQTVADSLQRTAAQDFPAAIQRDLDAA
jgi:hypothetical protein